MIQDKNYNVILVMDPSLGSTRAWSGAQLSLEGSVSTFVEGSMLDPYSSFKVLSKQVFFRDQPITMVEIIN